MKNDICSSVEQKILYRIGKVFKLYFGSLKDQNYLRQIDTF